MANRGGARFHLICAARAHHWAPRRLQLAQSEWHKGESTKLVTQQSNHLQDTAWHGFAPMRLSLPFLSPSPDVSGSQARAQTASESFSAVLLSYSLGIPAVHTNLITDHCTLQGSPETICRQRASAADCWRAGPIGQLSTWPLAKCPHRAQLNAVEQQWGGAPVACWHLIQSELQLFIDEMILWHFQKACV